VWTPATVDLGRAWTLLLYTDGLIEGRPGSDADALWIDGLLDLLAGVQVDAGTDPAQVVERLTRTVRDRAPDHDDDVAVIMLVHGRDHRHGQPTRQP
jgi:serine phosphatase RsbU (regulator of sigma subunit)